MSDNSVRLLERLNEAEKDADRLRNDLECLLAAKVLHCCPVVVMVKDVNCPIRSRSKPSQCRHRAAFLRTVLTRL